MMDQLLSLVFSPGFSTATAVDRLSGRGMGLSVVAEAARKLHGSVLLRPRFPWGTEAFLSVPFTAARQPLLLAEAEGREHGSLHHPAAGGESQARPEGVGGDFCGKN